MTKSATKNSSASAKRAARAEDGLGTDRENALLLREGKKIVEALGKMFAPSCEVVLHDLTKPDNAIIAIANPLSGRQIGEGTTEMGLARVADPDFPDVVQNYQNVFPDGRRAKSTSIGIRNSQEACIAAICLNIDVSPFETMHRVLEQMTRIDNSAAPVKENFRSRSLDSLREDIFQFAATRNASPHSLSVTQRRELVQEFTQTGRLQIRGAIGVVSEVLGVSRASIYNDMDCQ